MGKPSRSGYYSRSSPNDIDSYNNNKHPSFLCVKSKSKIPIRKAEAQQSKSYVARRGRSPSPLEWSKRHIQAETDCTNASSLKRNQAVCPRDYRAVPEGSTSKTSLSSRPVKTPLDGIRNDVFVGRKWSGCAASFPIQMQAPRESLATNPAVPEITVVPLLRKLLSTHDSIPSEDVTSRQNSKEPNNIVVEVSDGTRIIITPPVSCTNLPNSSLRVVPPRNVIVHGCDSPTPSCDSPGAEPNTSRTPLDTVRDAPLLLRPHPNQQSLQPSHTVSNVSSCPSRALARSLIPRANTYEGIFYKKKALEKFPGGFRYDSINEPSSFQFQAQAVRTTTLTQTRYDFEEDEEEPSIIDEHPNRKRASSRYSTQRRNSNRGRSRMRMTDICLSPIRPCHTDWSGSTSRTPTEMDVRCDSFGNTVTLEGHGDPVLITPVMDASVMTDQEIYPDQDPTECAKCKVLHTLLNDSESMRIYVTRVLAESKIISAGVEPRSMNPLVMKAFIEAMEKGPKIPSFDMENHIRQYFQSALYNKDFSTSPFSPAQLFHVALAARESMAQAVLSELGTAERVLKGRYDALKSLAETGPVRESEFWQVLDGYRRWVRYMYHFYLDSIKKLHNYEETYLSKEKTSLDSNEDIRLGTVYSRSQTVVIDGVEYEAIVIPVHRK